MSGCYSVIGYKEAWLSLYYPLEFTYGCLKVYTDKDKKIDCINNARKRGVNIMPPDINLSQNKISLVKENGKNVGLIFGLSDIKDAGEKACEIIVAERNANGDYINIYDFVNRLIDNRTDEIKKMATKEDSDKVTNPINRKTITALIEAGAFDSLEPNRFKTLNIYNSDINYTEFANPQLDDNYNKIKDKNGKVITKKEKWKMYDENRYTRRLKLQYEYDKTELYMSEHPLDIEELPKVDFTSIRNKQSIEFAGIIRSVSEKKTKNNKKYMVLNIEICNSSEISIKLWQETRAKFKSLLKVGNVLIFSGTWNDDWSNVDCTNIKTLKVENHDYNINTLEIKEACKLMPKAPVFDAFTDIDDII